MGEECLAWNLNIKFRSRTNKLYERRYALIIGLLIEILVLSEPGSVRLFAPLQFLSPSQLGIFRPEFFVLVGAPTLTPSLQLALVPPIFMLGSRPPTGKKSEARSALTFRSNPRRASYCCVVSDYALIGLSIEDAVVAGLIFPIHREVKFPIGHWAR